LKADFGACTKPGDLPMNVDVYPHRPSNISTTNVKSSQMDYQLHRPMTIPLPPPPAMSMHHPTGTPGSSLPISGERLSASSRGQSHLNPNKKQRMMSPNVNVNIRRASSDDSYSFQSQSSTSSVPPSSFRSQQQTASYHPFQGGFASSPTSLLSTSFDFAHPTSSSRQPLPDAHRSASFSMSQPRPTTYQDFSSQEAYQHLIRQQQAMRQQLHSHPHQQQQQQHQQQLTGQSHPPNKHTPQPDLFVSFLETEPLGRPPHEIPIPQPFGTLDWPVHSQGVGQHDSGALSASLSFCCFTHDVSSHHSIGSSHAAGTDDTNWLDFLSGGTGRVPSAPP
jgi:hypothetical protein